MGTGGAGGDMVNAGEATGTGCGTVFDRLLGLLSSGQARFRVLEHPAEGRSDEVARIRGTAPGQGAKAMLCTVKSGSGKLVLAVLRGPDRLDFRRVAAATGARKASLASPEAAMAATGCIMGAVPPFSFSRDIAVVVDRALIRENEEIAFNAGRLDRSIVMSVEDYVRLTQPEVAAIRAE